MNMVKTFNFTTSGGNGECLERVRECEINLSLQGIFVFVLLSIYCTSPVFIDSFTWFYLLFLRNCCWCLLFILMDCWLSIVQCLIWLRTFLILPYKNSFLHDFNCIYFSVYETRQFYSRNELLLHFKRQTNIIIIRYNIITFSFQCRSSLNGTYEYMIWLVNTW